MTLTPHATPSVSDRRFVLTWLLAIVALTPAARAAEVSVDCAKTIGDVRPLHGVNNGPLDVGGTVDLSAYYREMSVPLVRLHDSHWPNPDVVDVHAVFPDPAADPDREASYDFARTDDYIKSILDAGVPASGIVFRLGESIEHGKDKRHSRPPADPDRWAAVCAGIVRHYNDGWANGHRHGIKYWEIWNEPDNRPYCWTGSDDEFFRLYAATAKALKKQFPDLKVGGPAVGNVGRVVEKDGKDQVEPSPFVGALLDYCKRESAPLDFFSWHLYSPDPAAFARQGRAVRNLLDGRGFDKTESILDEWNYLPDGDWGSFRPAGQGPKRQRFFDRIGGPEGAAFTAAALVALQDAPVDAAAYYAGDTNPFGPFTLHAVPKKTFYALKAFKLLTDTPVRVKTDVAPGRGGKGRLFAAAGRGREGDAVTILVSNFDAAAEEGVALWIKDAPWAKAERATEYEVLAVDADHDLTAVRTGRLPAHGLRLEVPLKAPAVCVVRLRPAAAEPPP